ncbi:MAG: pentapeptide repeat-containing protein [Methylococcales bacterium]|nr:pentapeptide repeat-containing protein [Methylococcales bacterium]
MVSTVPDSPEEQLLVKILSFLESRVDPAKEDVTAVYNIQRRIFTLTKADNSQRRIFTLTNLLHEQRKVDLKDEERYDYDPVRIRECGDEKKVETQSKTGDPKPSNGAPDTEKKEPRKCYFIDGPFPRNLIMNERVLVANKELPPETLSKLDTERVNTEPDALVKAQGIDLRGRHLEYADFGQSSLPNADLRRARLKKVNFSYAKLEKAKLDGSELPGANLSGAQLPDANLFGTRLPCANLSFAQLAGSTLIAAQLDGADLSNAQLIDANLFGTRLPGANLSFAQLAGSTLIAAQLDGADLSNAQLIDANLTWAQLVGASLSNAQLPGAYLTEAQLSGADLTGVQLSGADLSKAQLPGTIFEHINSGPMEKDKAIAEVDNLNSDLKDLPSYRGLSGYAADFAKMLDVDVFRQKITHFADFSNLAASEGCLADESALKYLPSCKK